MAARREKPVLVFLQDSREQLPYAFTPPLRKDFAEGGSRVVALKTGDYSASVNGTQIDVAIERKSIVDLFACIGRERDRFCRELERMQKIAMPVLLVEANARDVKDGIERSQVSGRAALASLLCWQVRYSPLRVIFGGDRKLSRGIAQRILEEAAAHLWQGMAE